MQKRTPGDFLSPNESPATTNEKTAAKPAEVMEDVQDAVGETTHTANFQQHAEEMLNREQKDRKLPPIHCEVFLLAHGNLKDLHGVQERFKQADIFIPELAGWTPSLKNIMNDTSLARITPEQALQKIKSLHSLTFEEFFVGELQMIYGSHKPVVFIDYPEGDPLFDEFITPDPLGCTPNSQVAFDQQITDMRNLYKRFAALEQKRESYMLSHLERAIEEATADQLDLKNKPSLRALLTIGSTHTAVFHTLKRKDPETKQFRTGMPETYGYNDEIIRRFQFHKEVDDKLIALALIEMALSNILKPSIERITNENLYIEPYIRQVAKQFTYEETADIFERDIDDATDRVFWYLKTKGIKPPRNLDDIKQFLRVVPTYLDETSRSRK